MHTSSLLRVAALIALIQSSAHTVLFLRAQPSHGRDEVELVSAMKSHRWKFGGFQRSYWDFYFGGGLMSILWGVAEIFLLWSLAALAPSARVTPLVWILLVANVGHSVVALRYFFLAPVVFDAMVAIVLALALLGL